MKRPAHLDNLVASTRGETVLSVYARHFTRYPIAQSEVLRILNAPASVMRIDPALPWHLRMATDLAPYGHAWTSAQRVIYENTSAPYFLFFLPKERRGRIIDRVIEGKASLFKEMGLSMTSLPATPKYSRYCPLCVEVDLEKHGFARFHVSHQLPTSAICWIHKSPLLHARGPGPYETDGSRFVMPDRCLDPDRDLRSLAWTGIPDRPEKLAWLASAGNELLRAPKLDNPGEELSRLIRQREPRIGKAGRIAKAMRDFWSDEMLDWLGLPLEEGSGHAWYAGNLGLPHAKPIRCLAVLAAYFPNVKAFEKEASAPPKIAIGAEPLKLGEADLPELFRSFKGDLLALQRSARVPMPQLKAALVAAGVDVPPRKRRKNGPIEAGIQEKIAALLRTGESKNQIARTLNITPFWVDEVALSDPDLNVEWSLARPGYAIRLSKERLLKEIAANPSVTREQLWARAGNDLAKVRAQDPAWVESTLPSAIRAGVPPRPEKGRCERLDDNLCRLCPEIAKQQLAAPGRPLRVTPKSILSVIGRYGQYTVNKPKLPKTVAMFEEICESAVAFERRLMRWALSQFKPGGPKIGVSSLCLNGGVTRAIIRRNLDLVEEHLKSANPREFKNSMLSTYVRLARVDEAEGRKPEDAGSAVSLAAARKGRFGRSRMPLTPATEPVKPSDRTETTGRSTRTQSRKVQRKRGSWKPFVLRGA